MGADRSYGSDVWAMSSSPRENSFRRVAAFALAAAACAAILLVAQDGRRGGQVSLLGGETAKLDWNAFDQQLSHDWAGREKAMKEGTNAATLLHEKEEKDEKKRILAQKRLEMKKIAEEKKIQSVERQIELEASSQLASHDGQLSAAIAASVPQPQVVFSGHFQPGYDAKSPGEAAAEMAAWGPNANADWSRILSAERIQQKAARQKAEEEAQHPTIIHPMAASQLPKVGETTGQIERQALAEVRTVEAKGASSLAVSKVAKEAGEAAAEAQQAHAAATEGAKLVKQTAAARETRADAKQASKSAQALEGGDKAVEGAQKLEGGDKAVEGALERQLAEARAENQALQRLLVSVSAHPPPARPAPAPPAPQQAAPPGHGVLRCCDDSCETLSENCAALGAASAPPQPAARAPAAPQPSAATGAGTTITAKAVAGLSKKQLEGLLVSGNKQERAMAAGALYDASSKHVSLGSPPATHSASHAAKAQAPKAAAPAPPLQARPGADGELVKGLRRCCDGGCVKVSTVCPHTHTIDQEAIHKVAQGKGPSAAELQEWLISGTQAQKDKAAAILYAESQGKITPPAPPKAAAKHPAHAPGAAHAVEQPPTVAAAPPPSSSFTSQTAIQSQNIAAEAEGIVGNLAAEGH